MPRPLKGGLALSMLAVMLLSLYNHHTYTSFPRAPYDDVAVYLQQESRQPAAVIIHDSKMTFFSTHYFARDLPQQFIADAPGSAADTLAYPTQAALGLFATDDMATAVTDAHRVLYVDFVAPEPNTPPSPRLKWLLAHFSQTHSRQFQDVVVYTFEK